MNYTLGACNRGTSDSSGLTGAESRSHWGLAGSSGVWVWAIPWTTCLSSQGLSHILWDLRNVLTTNGMGCGLTLKPTEWCPRRGLMLCQQNQLEPP